jgi:Leucine-rich repeat (LRR) protein
VGTLSSLKLDVSHNVINELAVNRAGYTPYTSVSWLNLAHNNISQIARGFFDPIRSSLTHLELHQNRLRTVSRDLFGDMNHLLWLDLSNNDIQLIDSDSFFNNKNMQILLLDGNELTEIHHDVLGRASNLRVANFSRNLLRSLPDNLFRETIIEVLDISHNRMVRIPDGALVRIASTLRQLDASHNEFYLLSPDQVNRLICLWVSIFIHLKY